MPTTKQEQGYSYNPTTQFETPQFPATLYVTGQDGAFIVTGPPFTEVKETSDCAVYELVSVGQVTVDREFTAETVDPPVEPVDPPVEPVDPPVEPIDPPLHASQLPSLPIEPVDPPVEPGTGGGSDLLPGSVLGKEWNVIHTHEWSNVGESHGVPVYPVNDVEWDNAFPGGAGVGDQDNFSILNCETGIAVFHDGRTEDRGSIPASPFSPPYVLSCRFDKGHTTGSSTFSSRHVIPESARYPVFYFGMWFYVDAGYVNQPNIHGCKAFWPNGETSDPTGGVHTYTGLDGAHLEFSVNQQGRVSRDLWCNIDPAAARFENFKGQWKKLQCVLVANSADGVADGEVYTWVDDTLVMQYTDVDWQMDGAREWVGFRIENTYGGAIGPGTIDNDMYWYWDRIVLAGASR